MPASSYIHINIPLHKHFHHDCPHNCSTDAPELSDASRQFRGTFSGKTMWISWHCFSFTKESYEPDVPTDFGLCGKDDTKDCTLLQELGSFHETLDNTGLFP